MATGDMIGIGISALLANQRALTTTGHNISNANTEGYTRQRIEFSATTPQYLGNSYMGTGVQVKNIERVYNQLLVQQVNSATTGLNRLDRYYELSSQVDSMLSGADTGLGSTLPEFFNSIHDVANDSVSLPARNAMLGEANNLVNRFNDMYRQLDGMHALVNAEVRQAVGSINDLTSALAEINDKISLAQTSSAEANDLLDKRDSLLNELSSWIAVNTVEQSDGSTNVFIGNGLALVTGTRAATLSVVGNSYNPTMYEVGYSTGSAAINVNAQVSGGMLGGVLEFRQRILEPGMNAIGHLAQGLIQGINLQHARGVDLSGNPGGDFFTPVAATVLSNAQNTGSAQITVDYNDVAALTTSEYLLKNDGGGNWTLTRLEDNASLSGPMPLIMDGLEFSLSGAAAVGDRFLIRPFHDAARDIDVGVVNAANIAAGRIVSTSSDLDNQGTAAITSFTVLDPADSNLLDTVTIDFVDATNYRINGSGPLLAYTSGDAITLNGWQVNIEGVPIAGDSFSVRQNPSGTRDNGNILAMAGLGQQNLLFGGTESFKGAYSSLLADVGSSVRGAEINKNAMSSIYQQAVMARESVSGVNLDEEAANLIRFEQAYQAAAQIISVANDLFDSLLNAVRR